MQQVEESFDRVRWAGLKEDFKKSYGDYPSVISLLFIIGLEVSEQEIETLTKEQKQDIIHVGLCKVLETEGIYKFEAFDEDGWPHFVPTEKAEKMDVEKQENYIKQLIINYFYE